jgi:ATP-dependent DNA ligase
VQLYAFDIMALDGDDLRGLPLSMRKTNLARLLARRFGQRLERADLVSAHEAAVALDIRCEDRDEASADCHRV